MAAFTLLSNTNQTQSGLKQLFEFISDFKNFGTLLPADKVENFEYSGDQCSFNIKGITAMAIKIADKQPYHTILFSSDGLSKFNFNLKVSFTGEPDLPGTCSIELQGNLNPFIKAMAEKPLSALVNTMSQKLSEIKLSEIK